MNRSLFLRPEAKLDIREAFDWYEGERPGLGRDFLVETRKALRRVYAHPLRYPKIRGETRRSLLNRFPLSILYVVEEDRVVVIACFHGKRDPRIWQARG